jgi:hypothetical protein
MKKARGGKSNATVTLKEKRNVPTQREGIPLYLN